MARRRRRPIVVLEQPQRRRAPRRRGRVPGAEAAAQGRRDGVDWPFYHYDPAHTGYLPRRVEPAVQGALGLRRQGADGVPADRRRRQRSTSCATTAARTGSTPTPGKVKWKNQIGSLSASSPAYWHGRLFVDLAVGQDRRRCARATARCSGRSTLAEPHRVLPDRAARASSTSAARAATLYALCAQDRPREVEVPGRRRDQGLARAVGQHALRRRLQRPHVRGLGAHRARALVDRHLGHASSASRRATSTPRRRSPSAASTPATPTARSTRSAPRPASSPGRSRPAATSTRRRPSRTSTGTGPTVYIGSYDGNLYALDARTGVDALDRPRRRAHLRRPDRGRAHRLLRRPRLEVDLRRRTRAPASASSTAAAAPTTRSSPTASASTSPATSSVTALEPKRRCKRQGRCSGSGSRGRGMPAARRCSFASRTAVRARSGRSTRTAPRRRRPRSIASLRCSSLPAPPEAITGISTASATARVSSRS